MYKYKFIYMGVNYTVTGDNLRITETGCTYITLSGIGVASIPPGILVIRGEKVENM